MSQFDRGRYNQIAAEQARERRRSKTPIPERITLALDMRQLYGPEVDRACGVEEPAVDEWEAGTRVPTPEQIALLAELTNYPVGYFYEPVTVKVHQLIVCDRSKPRGKRCVVVDTRPDAKVLNLPAAGQMTLFDVT